MLIEVSKAQFDALVKEALDSMSDTEYVTFIKYVVGDAKLRGIKVELEVPNPTRRRRSRA
jgi:hypothetical protein